VSEAKYLVGIDLGTSNCAVAFTEPARGADAPVVDFAIEQLQRPGETAPRPLLPSCLYLPGAHELAAGSTRLPWGEQPDLIVGEFARWQGARVPGRLVFSAKSWLCHGGVDRSAAILPWGAPAEVPKLSPVDASARLLTHMAQAWNFAHPDAPIAEQEVIITVPASFDEVARALTVKAATQAGLKQFTLVEEPQAAFYDFTARHRHDLANALEGVRLVLVVDVGGGTSDFTLVQVGTSPEGPALRRIAVGEHLMLGGDNMDAALGRKAEERMLAKGGRLSTMQWSQLTHAARVAKETLLAGEELKKQKHQTGQKDPHAGKAEEKYNLSVVAEGSRLIGGALSTHLTRAEVEQIILEGFFPKCRPEDKPQQSARTALQELGLPYAQDAAITRHLAAFLRAHAAAGFTALGQEPDASRLPRPDAILLNGGVFNSPHITQRLLEAVSHWWPEAPPMQLLRHDSLELAVARGAAFYGLTRRGLGRRIGGGSAHALYVGLEKADTEEELALCVIPRGQEEGEMVELGQRVFQLSLGRPVQFPLFSTASDRFERAGEVVRVTEDLQPLPPIHTVLQGGGAKTGNVPVHLRATLTELGTLELCCVSQATGERWRLEFELRGTSTEAGTTVIESMPPGFAEARQWVERIYGGKPSGGRGGAEPKGTPPKDVKQLWTSLERTLGPREEWRLPVLRELWGTMFAGSVRRRRSAEHERICFQILGYTLRPGFGYPLDEWRCEQSVRLFTEGVEHHKEKAVWKEFWILWRRIAGGLNEARHQAIWEALKPHLAQRIPPHPPKHHAKPKGVQPEGTDEMVRLAASLEHLPASEKGELGEWIVARLKAAESASGPWTWALGRLGARLPIYGSVHKTLPPEQAQAWIQLLLEPKVSQAEGALFALAQLARLTGDRARDVDEATRAQVLEKLQSAGASPAWERMVREVVALEATDKARALGDTLPAGLSLA
jgi:molecular chaperone DnaK (HSP70)